MKFPLLLLASLLAATAAQAASPAVSPAPDFTLRRADGANLRLGEQRGQVVMLNFWASWCGPCKQEMPHLNRLYDKYRDAGFVLLGVNVDDDPRKAQAAAQQFGVRFPVLLDNAKTVSRLYDLSAMPTTVVIDRDGRVRQVFQGYRNGVETQYDAEIRSLVTE